MRLPCEGVGDVVGVEAPLGGVGQVIFYGVRVVEVGVQVRVHQDRGEEEDGGGQVEVEREVEELRENDTCATWREDDRHVNDLSQCGVTHYQQDRKDDDRALLCSLVQIAVS